MPTKYTKNTKTGLYSTLIWDGTYTADGKKHRKQLTSKKSSADLERKVYAFKKEVEAKVKADGAKQSSGYTLGEYMVRWIVATKSGLSDHTKKNYKTVINHFEPVADLPLNDVTLYDIQSIINANIDRPAACKYIAQTFYGMVRFAVKEHQLPSGAVADLCGSLALPKKTRPQKRALYPHEKKALFAADFDETERAFVYLLYFFGMRRSEALALMVSDFDFTKNTVSISKNLTILNNGSAVKNSPKSDRGFRIVPIPDRAVPVLKGFVEGRQGFIFFPDGPESFTVAKYMTLWRHIISKMQATTPEQIEGLTAHIFRHNYVSELCYKVPQISTKMIAKLAGDSEQVVLATYSHIMAEKEDPVSVLNDVFF